MQVWLSKSGVTDQNCLCFWHSWIPSRFGPLGNVGVAVCLAGSEQGHWIRMKCLWLNSGLALTGVYFLHVTSCLNSQSHWRSRQYRKFTLKSNPADQSWHMTLSCFKRDIQTSKTATWGWQILHKTYTRSSFWRETKQHQHLCLGGESQPMFLLQGDWITLSKC